MSGRLFVVGIGPGDPELLTLKAVRVLRDVSCIFVPKGREEGVSLALSIVQKSVPLNGKEIVEAYFPMSKTRGAGDLNTLHAAWDEIVKNLLLRLDAGKDAAFITIGDPAIYSTFFYLHDRLRGQRPTIKMEFIPGISSINAGAAAAGLSLGLGNDRIAILPANYLDRIQEALDQFDTVVLMKVNKVFSAVKDILVQKGLAKNSVFVSRAGMPDEQVCMNIENVRDEDINYFSLVIVRKR